MFMCLITSASKRGEAYEKLDGSSPKRRYHSFTDDSHLLIQELKVAQPSVSTTAYDSKDQLPTTKISQSPHPETTTSSDPYFRGNEFTSPKDQPNH